MEFAIQYLRDNVAARELSGRELEANVLYNDKTISNKYWSEAKKQL